jgi:hypothetical protein
MLERAALLAGFLALAGWHWARLERPPVDGAELALLALLGVAPAVAAVRFGRRIGYAAVLPVSVVLAAWHLTGFAPVDRDHPLFPIRVGEVVADGIEGWFSTRTPFDPERFTAISVDVRLAFFGIALALGVLMLRGRRPLLAIGAAFLPVALPSTVLGLDAGGLRAALFLGLALGTLYAMGDRDRNRSPRRRPGWAQAATLGVAAVAGGLVMAGAPGVSKAAFLDWERWDPLGPPERQVDVAYAWDQSYGVLRWPKKRTVVFEAMTPRATYWRIAVLSDFTDGRWKEAPEPRTSVDGGTVEVPAEAVPPRGFKRAGLEDAVNVQVRVRGLADNHLIGPGTPLRYDDIPDELETTVNADGTAYARNDLPRDAEYRVRTYLPNPSPTQLARAGGEFPSAVADGNVVDHATIPLWGSQERPIVPVEEEFVRASDLAWSESDAGEAATMYGAVIAVESWLRSGDFVYDQAPEGYRGGEPLVEFLTDVRAGYCQHFSGAMAMVLRLHGIPARVAAGFTEGAPGETPDEPWTVVDRDAHAWVEVYFPDWGWIPFDPTPTRTLPSQSSVASVDSGQVGNVGQIAENLPPEALRNNPAVLRALTREQLEGTGVPAGPRGGVAGGAGGGAVTITADEGSGALRFLTWLLSAAAVVLAALALAKAALVRWRYLARGPRAQAAAAYHDLSTYVADQGLEAQAHMTFEELAETVRAGLGADASAFAAAATAARYAPPAQADEAVARMRGELRSLKRAIRASLSLRDRIGGALRLRSVLAQISAAD